MKVSPPLAIDEKLLRVRRGLIARDFLLAISRAIAAIAPACLILGWLDHALGFPPVLRALELAGLIAWTARAFKRHALPALRKVRDLEATALEVEASFPDLGGRLVSRVEFRRRGEEGWAAMGASSALARAFCECVEREGAKLALERAIDWRILRGPAWAAAVLAAIVSAAALRWPDSAALWVQRTLLPFAEAPWPRQTRIEGIAGSYLVRRGDRLQLAGRALGKVPSTGDVTWTSVGASSSAGRSEGTAGFEVNADGEFAAVVGPLLDSMDLELEVGDARLTGIRAEVVIPPELESIEAAYEYPTFTGLAPERLPSGDVRAIVGTRVDLTLQADRPVARMEIVHRHGSEERREAVPVESGVRGRTSFAVRARGTYEVWLFDAHGFAADSPSTFVVEPIENEIPSVQVTRPALEHTVTPATRLRLRYEMTDDFGIAEASIRWQRRSSEPGSAPTPEASVRIPEASFPLPVPALRAKVVRGEHTWDLALLGLAPGDEIPYHLEARDEGEHLAQATSGLSSPHALKVALPEVLSRSLEARRGDGVAEMSWMLREELQARDAVSSLILGLPAGEEAPSPATLPRLQDEEGLQARLARQAEHLDERFEEVADGLEESYLAEQGRIQGLRAIAQGLRELSRGPLAEILGALGEAREALAAPSPDVSAGRKSLEEARAAQDRAIASLTALVAGEARANSLAELSADLSGLRDMESSVVRGARALLPRTFGKAAEALAGEDRQALEKLGAESSLLRKRLADWQRALEARAAAVDAPVSLEDLARRTGASPAGDLMEKTSESIQRNRLSEAAALGRSATDELSRMALILERESLEPADLMERRLRELEEILEREKRLGSRLEEPLDAAAMRQGRREQFETCERSRPLTFEEAGLPAEARGHLLAAQESMESAESLLGRDRRDDAAGAARSAAESLALAAEILRLTGAGVAQAGLPIRPQAAAGAPPAAGTAGAFGAGGGVDLNALSQLAADIALVARLRERQVQLLGESLGKRPEEPAAAARQLACAAQIPQLSRRVEVYLPAAAAPLEEARAAMVEGADRLSALDKPAAASRQQAALERLGAAEGKLRELWAELIETLARISRSVASGPSHGAAAGSEEERRDTTWTVLIREIVRLGRLIKEEDALMAATRALTESPSGGAAAAPETSPRETAAREAPALEGPATRMAARQRGLASRCEEIAQALQGVGEGAGSLIEALSEAGPFLGGAADMLEKERYDKALERQETAMEYLNQAWTVVTQSAAAAARAREAVAAEPGSRAGSEGGAAAVGGAPDDSKPWYWSLPPRARDAVGQSLEGRFPPKYSSAIERYYERLAKRQRAFRPTAE